MEPETESHSPEEFEDLADDLLHGQIRRRAHRYWEEEGCPDGRALEHWARAERDILNGEPPPPRTPH